MDDHLFRMYTWMIWTELFLTWLSDWDVGKLETVEQKKFRSVSFEYDTRCYRVHGNAMDWGGDGGLDRWVRSVGRWWGARAELGA